MDDDNKRFQIPVLARLFPNIRAKDRCQDVEQSSKVLRKHDDDRDVTIIPPQHDEQESDELPKRPRAYIIDILV
ncbi:MAG: hypothetical protein U9N14_05385 [Pseudomonadota bacterium]|nr:hypothetical protein [Pseudomonadota bacterium]